VLEKLSEMGLGRGRLPVVSNGAHIGAPEMLKLVGKELMEGVMTVVANWGAKGQEKLIAEFKQRSGEPWMTQDSISTYGDMWIFKDALEKAKVADRKKVAEAIRAMDTTEGPARFFPGGRLKFEDNALRCSSCSGRTASRKSSTRRPRPWRSPSGRRSRSIRPWRPNPSPPWRISPGPP
jgi:branched-chain amino acid transport system substrate-binding protein